MIIFFCHSAVAEYNYSGMMRALQSTGGRLGLRSQSRLQAKEHPGKKVFQKKLYSLLKTSCQFPVAGVYYPLK